MVAKVLSKFETLLGYKSLNLNSAQFW